MGSNNSKAEQLQYDSQEWEETDKSILYEVMRNKRGQQANLYHFNIKSQRELEDQAEIYHRRKSPANWVQVIGANLTKGGFGFCGTQENANVLTERIPVLLGQIPRLNRQQSLVVLYNALRGYNDISKIIVPAALTDRMIGFTSQGQAKVWINQNFGMNYPNYYHPDAELNQATVVANLVNAASPRTDLAQDFVNGLRSCGSFDAALNFIRTNGGVSQNVLEGNRINVASYLRSTQVQILRDTTPVNSVVQNTVTTSNVIPQQVVTQQTVYQPPTLGYTSGVQSSYRNPNVNFVHNPVNYHYTPSQVPGRYVEPTGSNKFSFTAQ